MLIQLKNKIKEQCYKSNNKFNRKMISKILLCFEFKINFVNRENGK